MPESKKSRLAAAVGLSIAFAALEILSDLWAGSLMLLGDAVSVLLIASQLTLSAGHSSANAPDSQTQIGSRPRRGLSLAVGAIFVAVAGCLVFEGYQRMLAPPPILGGLVMLVAVGSLAVRLANHALVYRHGLPGQSLKAKNLRLVVDVLGPLQVFAGALIVELVGWTPADAIVGVAISLFIVPEAWRLMRQDLRKKEEPSARR